MVQIAHDGKNLEKINEILLAAQQRFGNFGLEKTTMNEIASDLGISKAALYYYYPDKESLYKAVVEKETDLFLSKLGEKLATTNKASELLRIYSEMRIDYFRKLLNLSRIRFEDYKGINKTMHELRILFRQKEKEKITEILNTGKSQGHFVFSNVDSLSVLFLDALRGISLVFKKNRDITFFNDEDYASFKEQIMQFVNIFIKGISK
jgi:AcrR family transcriptional regulator